MRKTTRHTYLLLKIFCFGLSILSLGCSLSAELVQLGTDLASDDKPAETTDYEFGVDGVLKLVGSSYMNMNPRYLSVQADGKIVLGQFYNDTLRDYSSSYIYRLNSSGSLDVTYGDSAYVALSSAAGTFVDFAQESDATYALKALSTSDGFEIHKYLENGILDPGFGTNGIYSYRLSGDTLYARKLSIAPSTGTIYVGAYKNDTAYKSAVYAVTATGVLDSSFGTGGRQIFPNYSTAENPIDIHYVSDNEIYILNHLGTTTDRVRLRKFNSLGTEDGVFDSTPLTNVAIDTVRWLNIKKIHNDRLVIYGAYATTGGSSIRDVGVLIVCNLNGTPDTGFNSTGSMTFPHASLSYAVMDIQGVLDSGLNKDIQIALVETERLSFPLDKMRYFTKMFVNQYNYNGTLDPAYGTSGKASYIGTEKFRVVKFLNDGSVVAAGHDTMGTPAFDSALVRKFDSTLNPAPSFGSIGRSEFLFDKAPNNGSVDRQYKIDADNFIFTGTFTAQSTKVFVVKTDKTGKIDTSFGDNGYIRDVFNNGYEAIRNYKKMQDGSHIVCGESLTNHVSVAKFKSDGSRDTNFGVSGIYSELISTGKNVYIWHCTFKSNGETILILNDGDNIITAKIQADGTRDMSFGSGGLNLFTIPPGSVYDLNMLASAPDERTIVTGQSYDGSMNPKQFVFVIKPDGLVDTGFSGDGYVEIQVDTDSDHSTMGIAFGANGRFYTVFDGYDMPSWDPIIYINCYKADGDLDESFGGTGLINTTNAFWIDTNIWGTNALTIDTEGNLYVLGQNYSSEVVMKSWKSDGTENNSFGINGVQKVFAPLSAYRNLDAVAWDASDKSFKVIDSSIYRVGKDGQVY